MTNLRLAVTVLPFQDLNDKYKSLNDYEGCKPRTSQSDRAWDVDLRSCSVLTRYTSSLGMSRSLTTWVILMYIIFMEECKAMTCALSISRYGWSLSTSSYTSSHSSDCVRILAPTPLSLSLIHTANIFCQVVQKPHSSNAEPPHTP